jgi:hypothetical protein
LIPPSGDPCRVTIFDDQETYLGFRVFRSFQNSFISSTMVSLYDRAEARFEFVFPA